LVRRGTDDGSSNRIIVQVKLSDWGCQGVGLLKHIHAGKGSSYQGGKKEKDGPYLRMEEQREFLADVGRVRMPQGLKARDTTVPSPS